MEIMINSSQYMEDIGFPFWINWCLHDHENIPRIHSHDFIELVYIVRGEARHLFEGDCYDIRAGDVFIINPGEVHTYQVDQGKRLEIINCLFMPELIKASWLRELGISQSMDYFYVHPFLDRNERFYHRLNLTETEAVGALALLEGMIKELRAKQSGYSSIIRMKLVELLIMLSRFYNSRMLPGPVKPVQSQQHPLLLRRIVGYLERHYEKKISIPELSEAFNISTRQLNRIFKKETGMAVVEKIHQIRIEKAKQLLLETDDKVIQVAGRVGYEDPAFFSQLFRRQVGCSPGKYRDQTLQSVGRNSQ